MDSFAGQILLLFPIALLAYTTQAFTGFGSAMVVLTLGAHFFPVQHLIAVILPLGVVFTGTVAFRHRQDVDRDLLLKRIFPYMGAGVVLGLCFYPLMGRATPVWLLGVIVAGFSAHQLALETLGTASKGASPRLAAVFQVLAGVTHAFYTTGGPFLTYSLARLNLPKAVFRATLCVVWTVFNFFLTGVFAATGRLEARTLKLSLALALAIPLGLRAGEALHDRVSERAFRLVAFALLLASGTALFF